MVTPVATGGARFTVGVVTATIAWSHDLLDGPTKEAFAQLSAFRGGFTLTSAERVCDFDGDVLSAVASLAEQSLLRTNITAEHSVRL